MGSAPPRCSLLDVNHHHYTRSTSKKDEQQQRRKRKRSTSKKIEDETTLVQNIMTTKGSGARNDDVSSDGSDDDPRLAVLFSGAPAEEANKKPRLEEIQVHEGVILDCFHAVLQSYSAEDPASLPQWEPPPLYSTDESIQDWVPATLPLPAWAVQIPQELAESASHPSEVTGN
jgi:hypothetical protein